jgi:hypothetical protein
MRFVYAIMAHAGADQLARLIDRLLGGGAGEGAGDRVVLHLDAGSPLWREQRGRFTSHPSGRLHLIARPVRVRWGQASQVEAQRRLLRAALAEPFDYCHLISGACWPARARADMVADLAEFGPRRPVFADLWGEKQPRRMGDWWFDAPRQLVPAWPWLDENLYRVRLRLSWAATAWLQRRGLSRALFGGQPWLKGSSWYSAPFDAAQVLEREMSALLDCGRIAFTQCADEHVAPTILGRRFADRIEPARRYIDWSAGGYHPKLLRAGDQAAIIASKAWFARKVAAEVDDFFYALPSG